MTAEVPFSEQQRLRYDHVLIGWQEYLRKTYSIIDIISRGPEDFWVRVMENRITDLEVGRQIRVVEIMGGRHLLGNSYRAIKALYFLRELDMLPRVEPLYSPD